MQQRTTRAELRWASTLLVLCMVSVGAASAGGENSPHKRESQFMARSLAMIPHFVGWPEASFMTPNSPFVIGVMSPDPEFCRLVSEAAEGKFIRTHPVEVRVRPAPDLLRECHLLFVSDEAWQHKRWRGRMMRSVKDAAVLTVGEADGFIKAGGVASFKRESQRMCLEINEGAARRARLNISSKLLRLPFCTLVKDGE